MRVYQWEKGTFPHVRLHMLPVMCYHCEDPVCVKACKSGALFKEEKYGAVLVDSQKCEGCRSCWKACPYGAPQYDGDEEGARMSKCTMCMDRLEQELTPICVLSCSMRALEFGPMDDLVARYGDLRRLEDMPKETITTPAVVFKPADLKHDVVPWDPKRALELWRKRNTEDGEPPLPDFFKEMAEVTTTSADIVGRNRLVPKANNCEELMYYTTDDE
jgi:anaerobic dimethyl sulfoxide reductase subunit B (iron-sulfur subunit)